MLVVDVGVVRMGVCQRLMPVRMGVGLGAVPGEGVLVLMVGVMPVAVGVFQRFMRVQVVVAFTHMQPHAQGHQARGGPEQR